MNESNKQSYGVKKGRTPIQPGPEKSLTWNLPQLSICIKPDSAHFNYTTEIKKCSLLDDLNNNDDLQN